MNLQRSYKNEKLNESAKKKHILQDIIALLEQYEDKEDILYKLQEKYQLSDNEADKYFHDSERIFLQRFNEDDENQPLIKSEEEINEDNNDAKKVLKQRNEAD
jgi:hypothetical protein